MKLFLSRSSLQIVGALAVTTGAVAISLPNELECWPGVVPAATLPEQPGPVFCTIDAMGPGTEVPGDNTWFDDFDHGLSFASFEGAAYRVFETVDGVFDSIHWRHADHWMVDIAPDAPDNPFNTASGGAMIRPEPSFHFENGVLVAEAVFAAGHQDYADLKAWGEIVVTTAEYPAGYRPGGTYAYEMFPGHFTLGARLQADRHTICSLMDDTGRSALDGGRLWEMSFFQHVGKTVYGGQPGVYGGHRFRICDADDDPDTVCRDHFRLTLTQTSLRIDVNGIKYFEQTGIPPLPKDFIDGPVYVYFASIVGNSDFDVIRFHWDDVAVNP